MTFAPRPRLSWLAGLLSLVIAVIVVTAAGAACSLTAGSSPKTPTPSPSPSPSMTPTLTATATATPSPSPTSTPTATSTPEPTTVVSPLEGEPTQSAVEAPPADTPTPEPSAPPAQSADVLMVPPEIAQGQMSTVEVAGNGAAGAVAFADNVRYPLVSHGSDFWGVIAEAADTNVGVHSVTVQLLDGGGNVISTASTELTVDDGDYPSENVDLPADVNNSLDPAAVQAEDDARAATFAEFTNEKLWSGPFIWPVPPTVITDPFGIRRGYNGGPVSSFHQGIDIAADEGTPIVAGNSGRVAYVAFGPTHGNCVIIDHGDGVFSGYSHMSRFNVQVGQMVNKGDVIGWVGSTGMATGPHVHFEIDVRGVPVDPSLWTMQTIGP